MAGSRLWLAVTEPKGNHWGSGGVQISKPTVHITDLHRDTDTCGRKQPSPAVTIKWLSTPIPWTGITTHAEEISRQCQGIFVFIRLSFHIGQPADIWNLRQLFPPLDYKYLENKHFNRIASNEDSTPWQILSHFGQNAIFTLDVVFKYFFFPQSKHLATLMFVHVWTGWRSLHPEILLFFWQFWLTTWINRHFHLEKIVLQCLEYKMLSVDYLGTWYWF